MRLRYCRSMFAAFAAWAGLLAASTQAVEARDLEVRWSRDEIRWAEPVTVEVTARNPTGRTVEGGITLSFSSEVLVLDQSEGSRVYFQGSEIYAAGHRRTLRSRDVMVETWYRSWAPRSSRTASVTFFPLRSGLLQVRARAAWIRSLARRDVLNLPPRSSCLDQQGYPAHCRFVRVHESPSAVAALRESLGRRLAADPRMFEHLQRLLIEPTDRRALAFFGIELQPRQLRSLRRYFPVLKKRLRDPSLRDHPELLPYLLRLLKNPLDSEALGFLGFVDSQADSPEDPTEVFIQDCKNYLADFQGGPNLLSLIAAEGDLHFGYSRDPDVIVLDHWHRSFRFARGPDIVVRMLETIVEKIKPESKYVYQKEEVSGYSYLEVLRILREE